MKTLSHQLLLFGMMMSASTAVGNDVQFLRGETAPPLAINPPAPTSSDVINFTTPLDNVVYGNACDAASQLGGHLLLDRNNLDRTIDVLHDGNPPVACFLIYDPVIGATGSFGPLDEGNWVLRDANNILTFTVTDGRVFGDFNLDGELNVADVNLLSAQVRDETHDSNFDVNNDLLVNDEDRRVWVEDLKRTFFGDSNLDGRVDSADLNDLAVNWRVADATSWAQGDFNGDGTINSADLNDVGKNWQMGVNLASVPEPSGLMMAVCLSLVFLTIGRAPILVVLDSLG